MTLLFKAPAWRHALVHDRAASAFTQGEGEPQGMPHQYDIELKSLDMDKTILADVPVLSTGI